MPSSTNTDPDYRQYLQELLSENQDDVIAFESEEEDGEDDDSSIDAGLFSEVTSVRVLEDSGATTASQGPGNAAGEEEETVYEYSQDNKKSLKPKGDKGGEEDEWNRNEIDGLFCPICMEAWSSGGDHQVCCLPCGHTYGLSCIKRWLHQCRSPGKCCPQCKRKCTLNDVRVLYASRIVAIDEELQQKFRSLEAKCDSLEKKDVDWCKKEVGWQKREADLCMQVLNLKERTRYLEGLLEGLHRKPSALSSASEDSQTQSISGHGFPTEFVRQGCLTSFRMLKEWQIDGARFVDVDVCGQAMVVARRLPGMGGSHALTKMSLLAPHEREDIRLPVNIKAVKDLCMSPHARLSLLASLGKKLSVVSMESNNTVLIYDLPTAAWSCTWDLNNSHYIYAGLQNGMVLEFDMRQTLRPVESVSGLTNNPVHTLHSISADLDLGSGIRSVLTASSFGLCHWNFGSSSERYLVPESENQGVCISLAYGARCGDIVASFRPKIEMSGDAAVSQPLTSLSSSQFGYGVQGSHVLYKRVGTRYQKLGSTCANVSDIRLPKSAVIDRVNQKSLFAAGDEVTCDLLLQELPSLMVFQHLNSQKHPIRDVKYSNVLNVELLSCLSEDTLQLFST